jgi:hypothetical protein
MIEVRRAVILPLYGWHNTRQVRYADGGGLAQAERQRREQVRQQAADPFAIG